MRMQSWVVATMVLATSASLVNGAGIVMTDIFHASTGGGVWNDDSTGNWGIWVAPGTDPTLTTAGQFLNPGNPVGTTSIPIHTGVNNLLLFKDNCCGGSSSVDSFTFNIGTLNIGNAAGAYQTSNVAPTAIGQSVTGGGLTVTVQNLSWYNNDVFSQDFVGQGQAFGPNGTFDQIGRLTLFATPEPSSLILCGLGAVGLLIAARRRKA